MMSKTVGGAILVVALVSIAAVGCSSTADDSGAGLGPEYASEIPAGATQLAFDPLEEVSTPISAIVDRRRLVIRDEAAWEAFWDDFAAQVQPQPEAPAVDFSTHMVIAATMGQRSSGGYTISVDEVAEKEGVLYAAVQEVTPGVMCITTDVITAPAVAVLVPRHSGTVAFVDTELELPCAP